MTSTSSVSVRPFWRAKREVTAQLVGPIHGDQRAHGGQAAVPAREAGARPHVAEQHVVGELGELGCHVAHQPLRRRGPGAGSGRRRGASSRRRCLTVLFVADYLHPFDGLAVQCLLHGDVGHGAVGCGAVPVLHAGRDAHHVAGADDFNRTVPPLYAPHTGRDDQRLAQTDACARRCVRRARRSPNRRTLGPARWA